MWTWATTGLHISKGDGTVDSRVNVITIHSVPGHFVVLKCWQLMRERREDPDEFNTPDGKLTCNVPDRVGDTLRSWRGRSPLPRDWYGGMERPRFWTGTKWGLSVRFERGSFHFLFIFSMVPDGRQQTLVAAIKGKLAVWKADPAKWRWQDSQTHRLVSD